MIFIGLILNRNSRTPERQLYEAALDRMAREIAAAQDVDESIAMSEGRRGVDKGWASSTQA